MTQVLADLALDVEAATALSFRLARSFDRAVGPARGGLAPADDAGHQVLGVQDRRRRSPTRPWSAWAATATSRRGLPARVYRELPLNAIWEGSGNVMALDLLRVLQREPETVAIVMEDLAAPPAATPTSRRSWRACRRMLHEPRAARSARPRRSPEALATLAAGTILRAHAPAAVADAFIGTRLSGSPRQTYGQGLTGPTRAPSSSARLPA